MALDSASAWGIAIAAAVKAVGVTAGTPVTDGQLESIWTAVKTEDRSQLTSKSDVAGVTGIGVPGGPLPIALGPGAIS